MGASAQAQGVDTTCTLMLTKTDPVTVNVLYPDEAAVYWVGRYVALPGTRVRIDGEFPHTRYMSFNVYDAQLRPIDALADVQIEPDPGSGNPFRAGARRDVASRTYSVFIDPSPAPAQPEDRKPNTLYVGSGQGGTPNVSGYFIYRVYMPDAGRDETGDVGIPTATIQPEGGGRASRSVCADLSKPTLPGELNEQIAMSNADIPLPDLPLPSRQAAPTPKWRKFVNLFHALAPSDLTRDLGGSGGLLSNAHNAYLSAPVSRDFGQVVVTRMRAPTFPDTRDGTEVMPAGQLRYFSLCQNEGVTQRYIACRADDQSAADGDGFVTYVMSTPEHRPATATAECGVTWLPWGPFHRGLLIYRHMLPASDFAESIQRATVEREVETMGDYFPVSRYFADAAAYDREVGC